MLTAASIAATAVAATESGSWLLGGQNSSNTRNQASETTINASNVSNLAPKWSVTTAGDVSATPSVDSSNVYFPDSAGWLYAVDRATGTVVWKTSIAAATGFAHDYARATPAVAGSTLVIGAQSGKFETPSTDPSVAGGYVLGYNKNTGVLLWKTRVDSHFSAMVTSSALVQGNAAYVGVTSYEEAYVNKTLNGGNPYPCCSFRGSLLKLDVKTGAILWKTYTLPNTPGYSGATIWGSTPAIDSSTNTVFAATGNNYSLPVPVLNCVAAAADDAARRACVAANDYFDAIVAFDATTGAIKWGHNNLASDAWNVDCGLPGFPLDTSNGNCPTPSTGPDYDFGQGPMLFQVGAQKLVGAGEKSGDFLVLDRKTGAKVWDTKVGPGGLTGGLQWGSATDGTRIYVAESNSGNLNVPGYWSALNPATGSELWRTTDPGTGIGGEACGFFPGCTWGAVGIGFGYSAEGPVSTANGVVYACSLNPVGPNMVAMDAVTGAVKWTYASGSSCLGGAAIVDGTVFWGTGYRAFGPLTTPGNKLFAFTPNGT